MRTVSLHSSTGYVLGTGLSCKKSVFTIIVVTTSTVKVSDPHVHIIPVYFWP